MLDTREGLIYQKLPLGGGKFLALLTVRPLKNGKEITGYMGLTRPIRNL